VHSPFPKFNLGLPPLGLSQPNSGKRFSLVGKEVSLRLKIRTRNRLHRSAKAQGDDGGKKQNRRDDFWA